MNFKKINQAVALQKKANYQIDTYGATTEEVANELEQLVDSFTEEEAEEFLMVYKTTSEEEEFSFYVQSEIDYLRNK